jgi:hypothetical protein
MTATATAPSYAPHNLAPVYTPTPSNPLAPWREDQLGAVALFVTMAVLIVAVGVASLT